ncbi:Glutamate-cysteine ligase catalytic subunit [Penicillium citrinum]|uniref:Glutamate--cysteine ligase n=2 Tax=Penicillium TaxID=5073 RepID=A0A9W9NBD2_PENCI|nr:Glutamate-cysteine ligase catalytic subunit [Penicillium citrinum]KAJ5216704.1 Glutamate-cysteine ligase catalytic subunit [Penicillium citrinum]KAJ5600949.1 Glutamate-cysteine ligase catalytic subunit [Penicillium hetheringtonii]
MPFLDDTILGEKRENHICLDQQNIGRGSCSIQTTFQTANEAEARWLHDQFIPLGPCLLALTAATPIWKGIMVDTDSRWQRYGDLVDDRDSNERDCLPPGLYNPESLKPMDLSLKKYLVNGGMDHFLADHFASILSRDPLILTEAETKNMTPTETHLFESLYGYVWNHVRFKPPISENGPGWRVEFRPMEAQLTDFDNAAFAIFSFLLSRAIVCFHLNFYIPIDLVNESGKSCQKRDAVVEERFWFRRRNWLSKPDCMDHKRSYYLQSKCQEMTGGQMYGLMSANEIINGEETIDGFPGLLFFVHCYLDHVNVSEHERNTIEPCLSLIRDRARGISPTPASWMRNFVRNHEDYCKDSHVSEKVCYDMMEAIIDGNEHNRA